MTKHITQKEKANKTLKLLNVLIDIIKDNYTHDLSYTLKELCYCTEILKESLCSENKEVEQTLTNVSSIYQKLYPPRGGLSDFFIWREKYKERVIANEELEKIKEELWKVLDLYGK